MEEKCSYCGQPLMRSSETCPYCGAPNDGFGSLAQRPGTIDELQVFCLSHRMPLERMRFFIGEDYHGARAFGIYQDEDGDFVVYKNKADGTRAIRYRGPDEAHAVNEIYEKLKAEIMQRRNRDRRAAGQSYAGQFSDVPSASGSGSGGIGSFFRRLLTRPAVLAIAAVLGVSLVFNAVRGSNPRPGYYRYDNNTYYYQQGSWYGYDDDLLDWVILDSIEDGLRDNYADYYESYQYDEDWDAEDFSDSSYYDPDAYSSSDWDDDWDDDSDWDYDYDSWDSFDSDWDSDW